MTLKLCVRARGRQIMRQSQHGVALITVMMVLAMVVVIAVSMSSRLQLELQRQINTQQRQQALWLALGAEQFVQRTLKQSVADKENTNLSQAWATKGAVFPIGNATFSGAITDMQACFNLNTLVASNNQDDSGSGPGNDVNQPVVDNPSGNNPADAPADSGNTPGGEASNPQPDGNNPNAAVRDGNNRDPRQQHPQRQAFIRLLEQNAQDLSIPPDYLLARLVDWLDADNSLQSAGGAEENDYAALTRPYYTANSLMVSKSELRTILDVTPADYQLIAPLVCVIPQLSKMQVNVNTLQEEQAAVLAALIPNLSVEDAKSVIASRPEQGYNSVDDFFNQNTQLLSSGASEQIKAMFTVKSAYFQAEINIDTADSSFTLTTLFKLNGNQVDVVARRIGGPA
jgi:general secretion pathway protein K